MFIKMIKFLTKAQKVVITIELVNRIHEYVVENVTHVKKEGKLTFK